MRTFLLPSLFLAIAVLIQPAKAVIVVSDFSNLSTQLFPPMGLSWTNAGTDQYIQNSSYVSIAPIGGGDPKGDGYFIAAFPGGGSIDLTGQSILSLNARVDSGNTNNIIIVQFRDNSNTLVASGTFQSIDLTSTFSTRDTQLSFTGQGDLAHVAFWRVDGDDIVSHSVRYSFDNLSVSAIPEPTTTTLTFLGICGLLIRFRKYCN